VPISITDPKSITVGQSTYNVLKQMIIDGDLKAGAALQETQLAKKIGVSRTPVREALGQLENDGFIIRGEGFTSFVKTLSVSEFVEILHIRRLLEVETAGLAAENNDKKSLVEIRKKISAFSNTDNIDSQNHFAIDDLLHECIATMSGSNSLSDLIISQRNKTRVFNHSILPDRFEPGKQEHLNIIDAILANDVDKARAAMRTHIENVQKGIISHLMRL
jgi:DNA-binding GntR family transcriptional regulator